MGFIFGIKQILQNEKLLLLHGDILATLIV